MKQSRLPLDAVARIPFTGLDWVWFYPVGTVCNLECAHCLVGAGPASRLLLPLETDEMIEALEQVAACQDGRPFSIGLTGGEALLLKAKKYGRRLFPMIEACLRHGDVLILTNGLLADDTTLQSLRMLEACSPHSISYRVSLDGPTAPENDEIRRRRGGRPTFELIMASLLRFARQGIRPSVAYTFDGTGGAAEVQRRTEELQLRYKSALAQYGLSELELLAIPFFDQGSETVRRDRAGLQHIESPGITDNCISRHTDGAYHLFQCSYARSFAKSAAGETGWYKCPVLSVEELAEDALVAESFEAATCEITIEHPQCITCFYAATQGTGMSCSG